MASGETGLLEVLCLNPENEKAKCKLQEDNCLVSEPFSDNVRAAAVKRALLFSRHAGCY